MIDPVDDDRDLVLRRRQRHGRGRGIGEPTRRFARELEIDGPLASPSQPPQDRVRLGDVAAGDDHGRQPIPVPGFVLVDDLLILERGERSTPSSAGLRRSDRSRVSWRSAGSPGERSRERGALRGVRSDRSRPAAAAVRWTRRRSSAAARSMKHPRLSPAELTTQERVVDGLHLRAVDRRPGGILRGQAAREIVRGQREARECRRLGRG